MNILQIFPRFPWPLKDGGALGFYRCLSGFSEAGCKVTAAILNTSKHRVIFDKLPMEVQQLATYHLYEINSEITFTGAFKNLFEPSSYIISRFYDKGFEKLLVNLVKQNKYDVIIFESLQVAAYINEVKKHSSAPCIYHSHNVEHHIWQTQLQIENNIVKKYYLALQANRLAAYEKSIIQKFDALLTVTEADKNDFLKYGYKGKIHVMPFGTALEEFQKYEPANTGAIFHIGSMDWMPNVEAVRWFLKEVWPTVHKANPDVKFKVAGRNMPNSFNAFKQEGFEIIGEVENSLDFMHQNGIMIIPVFSGSGIRVKAIEGMAMGKCIVATTLGMEGVRAIPGTDYILANDAPSFIAELNILLLNPQKAQQIGEHARTFVFKEYNIRKIIEQALQFIKQIKIKN